MATVLITGAGRGIGLELVRQYAALGWRVHACARDPGVEALAQVAGDIERHALDVADPTAIAALVADLEGEAIDVLFNVAGVIGRGTPGPNSLRVQHLGAINYQDWSTMMAVNVFAPVRLVEALLKNIAASEQRKVITLSSVLGSMAANDSGGQYGYRSSKAAVNAVMKSMAIDLKERGIIALPMHPGWVRTDMGGDQAPLSVAQSAAGMIAVVAALTPKDAGRFLQYDGSELPW